MFAKQRRDSSRTLLVIEPLESRAVPASIHFVDPDLEQAVRSALNAPMPAPLTAANMAQLTTLSADANQIESLTGLEWAHNLQVLNLTPTEFGDPPPRSHSLSLRPLSGLQELTSVTLERVGLTAASLPTLFHLPSIETLDLRYNNIVKLGHLGSNTSLASIYVYGNPLTDVSGLKGRFVDTDLQPVGLEKADTVTEVAKALHYLPLKIYEYVLNNFSYQLYDGLMKGPQAAIETKAGSTLELANLLAQLLKSSGVSTRFTDARVEADAQLVMDWLGVTNTFAAFEALPGHPSKVLNGLGAITAFQFDTTWLEAAKSLPGGTTQWVDLTPAWKFRDYRPGLPDLLHLVPFDTAAENQYLAQPRVETAAEWYENQVAQYLSVNRPGVSVADVSRAGPIHQQLISAVPSALPFTVLGAPSTYTSIPAEQSYRVDITLIKNSNVQLKYHLVVPDVSLKSVTLSYSFLDARHVVPVLAIDGAVVARGKATLKYGESATLHLDHFDAGSSTVSYTNDANHYTGQIVAVGLNALQTNPVFLNRLQARVNKLAIARANGQGLAKTKYIRDLLSLNVMRYFDADTRSKQLIAGLTGAIFRFNGVASGASESTQSVTVSGDLQNPVIPNGTLFDIGANSGIYTSVDFDQSVSQQRYRLTDFNSSALENTMLEEQINSRSVSTIKSLQLAHQSGNPVLTINLANATLINSLSQTLAVKNDVTARVNAGDTVQIPMYPTPLDHWSGVGYMDLRPDGRTSTIIFGGTNGGASGGVINPPPPVPDGNFSPNQDNNGDPVNIANGNVTHDETDISLPGIGMPLRFSRHFDSANHIFGSDMGDGWMHTYGDFLSFKTDSTIVWRDEFGHRYVFSPIGGGNYFVPALLHGTFHSYPDGYQYRNKDGTTYDFDTLGRLNRIADRNGNGVAISFRTAKYNLIASVQDLNAPTRKLTFQYAGFRLTSIQDFTGRTWKYVYSGGRLTRVLAPSDADTPPSSVRYSYYTGKALGGLMRKITLPNGGTIGYTYYANRRAFQVTDSNGFTQSYSYNLFRERTQFTDERGDITLFDYNDSGNPIGQLNPDRSHESFVWQNELMTSDTDAFGKAETLTYDAQGNVTKIVDRANSSTSFTYEPTYNQVTRITRPGSEVTQIAYDARGNPTQVTDAMGGITSRTFDAHGEVLSVTSPRGNLTPVPGDFTTSFTYNNAGQVTLRTTDLPSSQSFSYDARGDLMTATDARGNPTNYNYDLLGRPISITDANQNITILRYDVAGNLVATTDRLGRTTRFAFDLRQNPVQTVHADGSVSTTLYDGASNPIVQTDELGRAISFVVDALNRPEVVRHADGSMARMLYDGDGRTVATVDPDGNVTLFAYDVLDRLTSTTDALGQIAYRSYDANNNLMSSTDALNHVTKFQYDLLNRQTAIIDAFDQPTVINYDANGNVTRIIDSLNHSTQYAYDVLDRKTASTDALTQTTTLALDAVGNVISVTDPATNATAYTYDNLNRRITQTDPLLATTNYGYDAEGNLVTLTDRSQHTRSFAYDLNNRRTIEKWLDANGTPIRTVQLAYDAAGQLTVATDPDSTYTYKYDAVGRATEVDNDGTSGVPEVDFSYAYDAAGNTTAVTDRIAGVLSGIEARTFDPLNRLTRISQSGVGVANERIDLAYNAVGELTTLSRFADLAGTQPVATSIYNYDVGNRLTGLTHSAGANTIAQYTWTLDAAGRVFQETGPDGPTNYSYDLTNQLTGADHSTQSDETYAYDANGNRTNAGYQTGTANQLLSDGQFNYMYDSSGNLVRRTELSTGNRTEYEWDYRNRLTHAVSKTSTGTVTAASDYTYDIFNRRIAKSVDPDGVGPQPATITRFVYDGAKIALQFDGSGTLTHRYLYGPTVDQIIADETSGGQVAWALTDNLGSVRDVIDSNGNLIDHIRYDSFGRITAETNSANGMLFGFTGREFDRDTGLQYNRARYYDSVTGRFIGQDPFSFGAGDSNLYRYVGNDSANATDPSGLDSWGGFSDGLLGATEDITNDLVSQLQTADLAAQTRDASDMVLRFLGYLAPAEESVVRFWEQRIVQRVPQTGKMSSFLKAFRDEGFDAVSQLKNPRGAIRTADRYAANWQFFGIGLDVIEMSKKFYQVGTKEGVQKGADAFLEDLSYLEFKTYCGWAVGIAAVTFMPWVTPAGGVLLGNAFTAFLSQESVKAFIIDFAKDLGQPSHGGRVYPRMSDIVRPV